MGKLKLMTIVGTRPEVIRLSEVIKKCDLYFDQYLAHTGQNYDYELDGIFFDDLRLRRPDEYFNVVGENLGETIGNVIARSYECMLRIQPDAILILGDTNSCLSAISAKRLHIPIFHMEAGNRCFDECLPEETNRRIVDHIADVNMCYSEHARRYLNSEGTAKERTYVTGSPMAEVLSAHWPEILRSDVLKVLGLRPKEYILLSAHREENIDDARNFDALMSSVNKLAEKYDKPIMYSMHPRSRKYVQEREFRFDHRVRTHRPLSFTDYNQLQMNAFCVVSDSGTLPEEAAYFNTRKSPFPAVCVRTSTERPEAIDAGCFIIGSVTSANVLQAVDIAVRMANNGDFASAVPAYVDENVSTKVVKIIQSYTRIVDQMVWRKG